MAKKAEKTKKPVFDDSKYGYGYDYLLDEERPADTDADEEELEGDCAWWEDEPEEQILDRIRQTYLEDYEEVYRENETEDEVSDIPPEKLVEDGAALKLALPPEDVEGLEETAGRKLLKRELRDEALRRFEESARTVQDFKNVRATWDKLDANRERRERYHELLRGDVPVDYQVDYASASFVPRWLNNPMVRQMQRGNFLDYFCDCPYEMHDLITEEYLRQIIRSLREEHKEIFYFLYLRLFSPQYVAQMRGQTDRNIRKVRDTVLRKIHKKMARKLRAMLESGYRISDIEREFLWERDRETEMTEGAATE